MKIEDFKDKHEGEIAFIVCNGPSLDKVDLSLLKDKITFGSNRIFQHESFVPTYYSMEDWVGIRQLYRRVNRWKGATKIVAQNYASQYIKGDDVVYINFVRQGNDPDNYDHYNIVDKDVGTFYWAGTVTVLLIQMAYYMGCNPIYIVGADHWKEDITTPPEHFKGAEIKSSEGYNPTKVSRLNMGYQKARDILEPKGVEIYNSTYGGYLEVFKRKDFDEIFIHSP